MEKITATVYHVPKLDVIVIAYVKNFDLYTDIGYGFKKESPGIGAIHFQSIEKTELGKITLPNN